MRAALRAEALKVRRSAALRLVAAGLMVALLQGKFFLMGSAEQRTWQGLTAWQNLWIAFLLPLFLALLAGLTSAREAVARGGGLWWRAPCWHTQGRAELLWLLVLTLMLNAAVILPTLGFGHVVGLEGELPYARLVALAVVLTFTAAPLLALGQRFARRFGLVAVLVLFLAGSITGIWLSEKAQWVLNPWAWPLRATFSLTGSAANGLPLPADSPFRQLSPWPVVGLAVAVTSLLSAWPYAFPSQQARVRHNQNVNRAAGQRQRDLRWAGLLASEVVKYRHTSLPLLVALAPVLTALFGSGLAGEQGIWEVATLLVLPFAASLLPALVWGREAEAWRALRCHSVGVARLYGAKLMGMWLMALLSGAGLFLLATLLGYSLLPLPLHLSLYALSALMMLALHLWIAAQWGTGTTLGVGLLLTLSTLVLGGTGLGEGIWSLFPWVWAAVLPSAASIIWPYLCVLAGLAGFFAWLGAKAAKR